MNPDSSSSPDYPETFTRVAPKQSEATACAAQVTAVPTPFQANLSEVAATGTTFGRYVLIGEIARGGMGVVYRARQEGLERLVALKMILGAGVDRDTAQRFLVEAQSAASLDHPNVVPIYDSGEIDGRPYFTMALIDGPNLRAYATERLPLPIEEIVRLFGQIVAGVAHAHQSGIIHRDLKPANVLIDRDGRPRVTDFGLAKRSTGNVNLTTTGQVIGTPAYMAPEQARESKDVGPAADVYSLGAILYFLLTGRPPFEGDGVTDLLIKVVTQTPVGPHVYNADIPLAIEQLCLQCLAKSPADRPVDATALAAAFAEVAQPYMLQSSGSRSSLGDRLPSGRPRVEPEYAATVTRLSSPTPVTPPLEPTNIPEVSPPTPTPAVVSTPLGSSRLPLIAGLSVAVLAVVGVGFFLATRSWTGPTDPVAATGTTPSLEPPSTPAVADIAFPAPTRADFALKVHLSAPTAKMGPTGVLTLTAGVSPRIHLQAERDCHVSVWSISPNGEATRLFPNDDEMDDRLTAGVERIIPGNAGYELEANPTDGPRVERLRVIATTGTPPSYPLGAKQGRYRLYSAEKDRAKLASAIRGIGIKKARTGPAEVGEVTESELLFRVQK